MMTTKLSHSRSDPSLFQSQNGQYSTHWAMGDSAKLVLLGNENVGKTAILRRVMCGTFSAQLQPTVASDIHRMKVIVSDQVVNLVIWDTAGQEIYRCITAQYYRDAAIALVVFSLTEMKSLSGASHWIDDVKKMRPSIIIVLAGNKSDLAEERKVPRKDAAAIAAKHGIEYVETSAFTGSGLQLLFETIAHKYIEDTEPLLPSTSDRDNKAIVLEDAPPRGTSKAQCC
jgi:Rab family protein